MSPATRKLVALGYGFVAHGLFVVGVGMMVVALATGVTATPVTAFGRLHGGAAWAADAALALQFPLLHTPFLGRAGRRFLARLAPPSLRGDLATTLYSAFAALQLVVTFGLWSPSGVVWGAPHGALAGLSWTLYAASWLLVVKAMSDASLALQTGALGWWAAFRGRRPAYPPMPTRGLFARWRQPIYTAFAAALVTGPVWTPDHLLLALTWGAYCVVGPRFKERRYAAFHGEAFARYQARVPYWLPRLRARP